MSGHSKWSTIKHKKGSADAKRGKIFTKLTKEIMVSAKLGGPDADANSRLRAAVLKARGANMPKDTIEKAINKGIGNNDGAEYFENIYEGYAPNGIAIMVETLTDNKNRTAADIRSIFTKSGGNLGESGCVSYLFARRGSIVLSADSVKNAGLSDDECMELALDLGAEDVDFGEEGIEILTSPEDYEAVLDGLKSRDLAMEFSECALFADSYVSLGLEESRKVLALLEKLDDNDDVQHVSSNLEIPEGV